MIIAFFKSNSCSSITDQRIQSYTDFNKLNLNPNNKKDAKKIFRSLIAQFGLPSYEKGNFVIYSLDDSKDIPSINDFCKEFNEYNIDIIDPECSYSMVLNLTEKEVKELLMVKTIDYVIVDRDTKMARCYGNHNEIVDVCGSFETANEEVKLEDETIQCLLSYPKENGNGEVYVLNMEYGCVEEIDSFEVRLNNTENWNDDVLRYFVDKASSNKENGSVYIVECDFICGDVSKLKADLPNFDLTICKKRGYNDFDSAKAFAEMTKDFAFIALKRKYSEYDIKQRFEIGNDFADYEISVDGYVWGGHVYRVGIVD